MFGVIRIDGNRLSHDFYMIDPDNGSHVLYDKLRIYKTRGRADGLSVFVASTIDPLQS